MRVADATESMTGTGAACATAERALWALSRSRSNKLVHAAHPPPTPRSTSEYGRGPCMPARAGEWMPCDGWGLACQLLPRLSGSECGALSVTMVATDGHEVGVITLALALSTTRCSRSPRSCGCSAPQFTRSEISDTESPLIGVASVPSPAIERAITQFYSN